MSLRTEIQWRAFALAVVLLLSRAEPVGAQATGLLYDPEPPANSAYARVIQAAGLGLVDVLVDGKPRVRRLAEGSASDYLVLAAGIHKVALSRAGQQGSVASINYVRFIG